MQWERAGKHPLRLDSAYGLITPRRRLSLRSIQEAPRPRSSKAGGTDRILGARLPGGLAFQPYSSAEQREPEAETQEGGRGGLGDGRAAPHKETPVSGEGEVDRQLPLGRELNLPVPPGTGWLSLVELERVQEIVPQRERLQLPRRRSRPQSAG